LWDHNAGLLAGSTHGGRKHVIKTLLDAFLTKQQLRTLVR
jgi:hypothetical protein